MPFSKTLVVNGMTMTYARLSKFELQTRPLKAICCLELYSDKAEAAKGNVAKVVIPNFDVSDTFSRSLEELLLKEPLFMMEGGSYSYEPLVEDLAIAKEKKIFELKQERELAIDAPLTTPYGVFDNAKEDRDNITDTFLLLQQLEADNTSGTPITVNFTKLDNTTATLNLTEIRNIALLMGQKVQLAYDKGRTLKTAVDAATTVEEVNAVVW